MSNQNRSASYRDLFGRPSILEVLRETPQEKKVDRAVEEYSNSLRTLCRFKYVSSAVILDPNAEMVRYFLIYATNHPRGVEVFKEAEIRAARIQDDIRHETLIEKTRQPSLLFGDRPMSSPLILRLRAEYLKNARTRLIEMLSRKTGPAGLSYADIFCQIMAFPLVTPNDLIMWLNELEGKIRTILAGSEHRKKPSPMKDDRIVVIDRKSLQ